MPSPLGGLGAWASYSSDLVDGAPRAPRQNPVTHHGHRSAGGVPGEHRAAVAAGLPVARRLQAAVAKVAIWSASAFWNAGLASHRCL